MRVTEKGQVTIPKDLRDALGIGAGTEVEFDRDEDTLVVRKVNEGFTRGRQPDGRREMVRVVVRRTRPRRRCRSAVHQSDHLRLLTRDTARYRTYFPTVRLTTPDTALEP